VKISFRSSIIFLSSILWLFIAETAVTDLWLSSLEKQIIIVVFILILTFIIAIKHQVLNQKHILIYIFSFVIALISLVLRYIFIGDENFESLFKTFFKFFSVLILIVCAEIYLRKVADSGQPVRFPSYIKVLFFMIILSFFAYLLSPKILFEFTDHAGHSIKIVYGSFSSSIYNIGSASFARLNAFFDEPGTFGMFISFLVSIMYYVDKKITPTLLIAVFAGIVSVSLSYYLFLMFFLLIVFAPHNIVKFNMKSALGLLFIIIIGIILLNSRQEIELVNYIFERFESVSSNNTNRSAGNSDAIFSLLQEPIGTNVKSFDNREFSSSGIFVIAAYHGILYACGFVGLFFGFFWGISRGGNVWPMIIALGISILTRNNMFNYSGMSIFLLALLLCYLSTSNEKPLR
jgi:hypothetical protein